MSTTPSLLSFLFAYFPSPPTYLFSFSAYLPREYVPLFYLSREDLQGPLVHLPLHLDILSISPWIRNYKDYEPLGFVITKIMRLSLNLSKLLHLKWDIGNQLNLDNKLSCLCFLFSTLFKYLQFTLLFVYLLIVSLFFIQLFKIVMFGTKRF